MMDHAQRKILKIARRYTDDELMQGLVDIVRDQERKIDELTNHWKSATTKIKNLKEHYQKGELGKLRADHQKLSDKHSKLVKDFVTVTKQRDEWRDKWFQTKNHKGYGKYFSFAKYLSENYDWIDNTENGDIYNDTQNNILTEKEIFNKWLNDKQ